MRQKWRNQVRLWNHHLPEMGTFPVRVLIHVFQHPVQEQKCTRLVGYWIQDIVLKQITNFVISWQNFFLICYMKWIFWKVVIFIISYTIKKIILTVQEIWTRGNISNWVRYLGGVSNPYSLPATDLLF
jgi:hypothetical protein